MGKSLDYGAVQRASLPHPAMTANDLERGGRAENPGRGVQTLADRVSGEVVTRSAALGGPAPSAKWASQPSFPAGRG